MNIEKSTEILKAFRNYNKFYKEENKDLTITITLEAKESIDKAIERLLTAYEKEKEKNNKAIKYCKEKSTFQTFGDFELQNVLEIYINRLKHRILDILEE